MELKTAQASGLFSIHFVFLQPAFILICKANLQYHSGAEKAVYHYPFEHYALKRFQDKAKTITARETAR